MDEGIFRSDINALDSPTRKVTRTFLDGRPYNAASDGRIACIVPVAQSTFPEDLVSQDSLDFDAFIMKFVKTASPEKGFRFTIGDDIKVDAPIGEHEPCDKCGGDEPPGKILHHCGCELCDYNDELIDCPECNGRGWQDNTTDEAMLCVDYYADVIMLTERVGIDGLLLKAMKMFTGLSECSVVVQDDDGEQHPIVFFFDNGVIFVCCQLRVGRDQLKHKGAFRSIALAKFLFADRLGTKDVPTEEPVKSILP
jgi:hypothetical protein